MPSLLETVNHLLRQGDNLEKLGAMLGVEADRASVLVDLATPVLITGLADRAFEPGGSDVVVRLLDGIDPSIVDNPLVFVERGDETVGEGLLLSIFSDEHAGLRTTLAERGGVPDAVVARLMPGILALAIGVLGRRRAVSGVDEAGVLELLATEKSVLPADRLADAGSAGNAASADPLDDRSRVPAMVATVASADAGTSPEPVETTPDTAPDSTATGDRPERRSTPEAITDTDAHDDRPSAGEAGDGSAPNPPTDGERPPASNDRKGKGPLMLIAGGLAAVVLLAWTLSRVVDDEPNAPAAATDDAADNADRTGDADQAGNDSGGTSVDAPIDGNDNDEGGSTDEATTTDEGPDDGGEDEGEESQTAQPVGRSEEPVTINEELSLDPITFEVRSATITDEGLAVLDEAAEYLKADPEVTVEIAGHTDSDGETADNIRLSQDRADVVKAYLESLGIDGRRMTPIGYGEDDPIASNDTDEGKAQNRRIEFVIQ